MAITVRLRFGGDWLKDDEEIVITDDDPVTFVDQLLDAAYDHYFSTSWYKQIEVDGVVVYPWETAPDA